MRKLTIAFALLVAAHGALAQTTTTTTTTKKTTTTTTTTGPANSISCLATGQELMPIPEARRGNDGVLRATLATISEQVRMTTGTFGDGKPVVCYPQWVREYRLLPYTSASSATELANPMPGPTLRAQVGDLVEISFLNQIDAAKFPNSDKGCDQTSTYTGTKTSTSTNDEYPDCFALSTTTNMHYHGTHTNPRTTGDNVFLEVRPSPRDDANNPIVTPDSVRETFDEFFRSCETKLTPNDSPKQWPYFWDEWPENLRKYEAGLTAKYYPDLEKKNRNLIRQGEWPQYFVGNYPYCYRLPKYNATSWPPASTAAMTSPHTHGEGSAEMPEAQEPQRPLIMGQSPGTHWYHAHKHGSTTINVSNGMTGVFIIEGDYDAYIREQYKNYGGIAEKVIVINQLLVTPSMERGGGGGPGPHFSVNGRLQPKITMKGGEVQLWRIANSSARAGIYFLAPTTGVTWKQTAFDGVQFADSNYQKSSSGPVLLAAGNRADLLVKAPMLPAGQTSATYQILVENTVDPSDRTPVDATAAQETLLTVVVNANGTDTPFMTNAPPMPPFLADIQDSEVKGTQELTFATTGKKPGPVAQNPAQHTINGIKFNGEVGVAVRLNNVEEWKVINETYAPLISHPFHIHINPFQIVEVFDPNALVTDAAGKQVKKYVFDVPAGTTLAPGQCALDSSKPKTWAPCDVKPLGPNEHRIWWDVFSIPSGATATTIDGKPINDANGKAIQVPGYFKMRSRFVDYSGWYVLHCHILAHEDRGMMTVVDVTPLQPPYSHH